MSNPSPKQAAGEVDKTFDTSDRRGLTRVNLKAEDGKEVKLYDASYALVVGVSDYVAGWPKLPGVRKDIEAVARARRAGSPEIRHGRPCIAGTGISVHRVAIMYKLGYGPEEIVRQYPHLSLAGVYAALAYYHANQVEVEAEIAADEAEADRIEAEWYRSRNSEVA